MILIILLVGNFIKMQWQCTIFILHRNLSKKSIPFHWYPDWNEFMNVPIRNSLKVGVPLCPPALATCKLQVHLGQVNWTTEKTPIINIESVTTTLLGDPYTACIDKRNQWFQITYKLGHNYKGCYSRESRAGMSWKMIASK